MKTLTVVVSAIVVWSVVPANAAGEVTNCTEIVAVPVTIQTPGIYCLKDNLNTNRSQGFAIRIGADRVVIELNGWTLRNTNGTSTTASGIYVNNRENVTIRNGTIEGFYRGIWFDNKSNDKSKNHIVEHVRAVNNGFAGIQVEGENLVVRKNFVAQTGPSDNFTSANGIYLNDFKNARVSDNTVDDTQETSTARGIFALTGSHLVLENNMVSDTNTATATYAVHLQSVSRAFVIANRLINVTGGTTGIRNVGTTGITCINNVIDSFNNTTSLACNTDSGTLP